LCQAFAPPLAPFLPLIFHFLLSLITAPPLIRDTHDYAMRYAIRHAYFAYIIADDCCAHATLRHATMRHRPFD